MLGRKGEKKEGEEGWEMVASNHEQATRKHDLNENKWCMIHHLILHIRFTMQ